MAELEKLVTRIEGDLTGLRADLGKASALTDKAAREMSSHFSKVDRVIKTVDQSMGALGVSLGRFAGAAAAGAAIGALSNLQQKAIAFGSAVADQALQTGLSTTAIQELTYAGLQLGLTEEKLTGALSKLSVNIGRVRTEGAATVPEFQRLGVALTDANGAARSNEAVFRDVVDKLKAIQDPATRAAEAVGLFGKEAGPKFAELIGEGSAGLDRYAQAARDAGAVLEEDYIAALKKTGDEIAALDRQIAVNLTRAFGTSEPLVKLWKETLVAATSALAEFKREADGANAAAALFGPSIIKDVGGIPVALENAEQAAEDYLAVLERIRTMGQGLPAPFANQPEPFQGQIPLRPNQPTETDNATAAEKARLEAIAKAKREAARKELDANLEYGQEYMAQVNALQADEVNAELAFQEQIARIRKQASDKHIQQLGIDAEHYDSLNKFETLSAEAKYNTISGLASGFAQSMSRTSKKAFEISKALAIAESVVNAYRAMTAAFANSGGNIYVGLAKAAVAAAYCFAQVAAIRNTQFGGGGGGAVSAGSAAASAGDVGGGGFSTSRGSERTIVLQGINPNDLFSGRQILDLLNQATADGGRIHVAGTG